ncbi:GvpL/GvpF family gas vesicle protein [Fictibacillus sp. WQ 8-8]|uniref:GvpL/GvpF family gas vesicle protein n=1 Tax=Fictibacillus sp. WQ 8-8 TaxID=2938788 RepID=UPI00210BF9F2|nr:GvpL/GvpF family gas vesicle protein [Fictibacillus sp. WQ 8-8]MCQ6264240.1 GvpL/GvpF family gas vesicle protein [Fictibacillus sp. WQ 8-8]
MAKLVYLYGLIPTEEAIKDAVPSFRGLDEQNEVYTIQLNEITAVVCDLDADTYSEESIKEKMNNDMEWLQGKALHHHEALLALQKQYTVIPMKFCTIYTSENSLIETIEDHQKKITNSFTQLAGNEEWNLKIYCDHSKLKDFISGHNSLIEEKKEEISKLSPGRQFFEKRKIDQLADQELEKEINKTCEQIHEELTKFSLHDSIKKNWGKDVTGKQFDMCWNSVYLIPADTVEEFLEEIKKKKNELAETGWKFEASGPWPAYHFASLT